MSRTIKGKKHPGKELWSKRPLSGFEPNKENKRATHQIERARAKAALKKAQDED